MRSEAARHARLEGSSVLIVEDWFLVAEEVRDMLESVGARVLGPASSVASAMNELRRERPDAAVLDVSLDEGDVFPFARTLLEERVPFIFMTGHAGEDVFPPEFRALPCLKKPVNAEELGSALRRVLSETGGAEHGPGAHPR